MTLSEVVMEPFVLKMVARLWEADKTVRLDLMHARPYGGSLWHFGELLDIIERQVAGEDGRPSGRQEWLLVYQPPDGVGRASVTLSRGKMEALHLYQLPHGVWRLSDRKPAPDDEEAA